MASIVEFFASPGLSLRLDLYDYDSPDVRVNGSGDVATAGVNNTTLYRATISEDLSEWHYARVVMVGANVPIIAGDVYLVANQVCKIEDRETDTPISGTTTTTTTTSASTSDGVPNLANLMSAPEFTRTDEGAVRERTVDELIKADAYLKGAAAGVPWGLRIAKTKPNGTVNDY